MLVRERRAAQLRSDGLRIKGLVEIATQVQVLTDASQLRGADTLIVAMKTPGTAEALEPLRNADIGVAFSIQNGMWKNDALASVFGAERVLGCLANTSGELLPSGEVLFTRNVNIYIGELPTGSSARAEGIAGRSMQPACAPRGARRARPRVDQVRRLGRPDADVDHDARYDLALPDRSRLRAGVDAAGAGSGGDCQGGGRDAHQRGHVVAAARHLERLRGRGRAGGAAGGPRFSAQRAQPSHVFAPGPGSGPAAGDPGNAGLCRATGTTVAAARAVARLALPSRGCNRSDADTSGRSALAVPAVQ